MTFTSAGYLAFLIVLFFLYWSVCGHQRLSRSLLLAANLVFYLFAAGRALGLLLAIASVDYTTARLMGKSQSHRRRRLLLLLSLATSITSLCIVKYAGFAVESTSGSFSQLGLGFNVKPPNFVVPLGISFFVFQSIAYVVDVYRKDSEPAASFDEYLTFVLFFPTIVAGPILRSKQLIPQLRARLRIDDAIGSQALFLIAIGLVKKIAIADYLSANLVERVFDFPERFSSLEVFAAVYGYALQIYADFSGYSDIAIGSALLLGFRLPVNFNAPYRSASLPEFWRRWHISLSTWLRDYLFFSLAGPRRRNRFALYGAVIVTMLIGGLWHGAAWTFVLWGLMHGIGLALARGAGPLIKRKGTSPTKFDWRRGIAVLFTFNFVVVTWVFFRADSVSGALALFSQIATFTAGASNLTPPAVMVIVVGMAAHWIPDRWFESIGGNFARMPALAQASALFALAAGLYAVASSDVAPFIYARF